MPDREISDSRVLRVVRSSHQVGRVAKALRNCAEMYEHRVRCGEYVLVALRDTTTFDPSKYEKPLALGGWDVNTQAWDQIVEGSNRTASLKVCDHFLNYEASLLRWLRLPADD